MAQEIAYLIAEITRPDGASNIGRPNLVNRRLQRAASGNGGRGRARGRVAGLIALAIGVGAALFLMLFSEVQRPRSPVRVRESIPAPAPVAAVLPPATSSVAEQIVTPPSTPLPSYPGRSRRERTAPVSRVLSANVAVARVKAPRMLARRAGPGPSDATTSPLDRPSPHLTGAALARAEAEDAIVTRQRNLEQLRDTPDPEP